ncbi:MAG: hypothetical protein ACFFDN_03460 [Candidatus Hodarchaeota archaeon]
MNFNNRTEVEQKIKELVAEVKVAGCSRTKYDELGAILNKIAQDQTLLKKYEDLYDDAADELVMSGVSLEKCGCDPLLRKIPGDKEPKKP